MKKKSLSSGLSYFLDAHILQCPHCKRVLRYDGVSLVCDDKHTFDVARQGYVNLAGSSQKPSDGDATYSTEFVQARRLAIERGFFSALSIAILKIVEKHFGKRRCILLDAGSGEGSFLEVFTGHMVRAGFSEPACLGIDLAVPGVRAAAGRLKNHAWCVADLAQIPCAEKAFDVVLNILSPANYAEFSRVLKQGGLVLKVVPTQNHLAEIRRALHGSELFSNVRVVEHFGVSVELVESVVVEASIPCGEEAAATLFAMTPLSWHATREQKAAFLKNAPEFLSVSFEVLVGRVSGN